MLDMRINKCAVFLNEGYPISGSSQSPAYIVCVTTTVNLTRKQ